MWVRGLKLGLRSIYHNGDWVAPYVGAWIETQDTLRASRQASVAPYVGAWIETWQHSPIACGLLVAPYVGAWIETWLFKINALPLQSHPMWVRGLKLENDPRLKNHIWSHPMWVRGLKQT